MAGLGAAAKRWRRALRAMQRRQEGRRRKRMLGDHVAAVVMRSDLGLFAIDVEDDAVRPRRGGYRPHVEEEIARAAEFIDRHANVLVVGAHIGMAAIPLARLARGVWAIEPNPQSYTLLNYNIALNQVANLTSFNFAASDRAEEIEFVANRSNSGGAKRMPKVKSPIYFNDRPEIINVPARPLDEALAGIDFDLVFMDCEGSEYYALRGMKRILSGARALFIEFLPHHLKNVSGVAPEELVDAIGPAFRRLTIPSQQRTVAPDHFKSALRDMYDRDQGDSGLVFSR